MAMRNRFRYDTSHSWFKGNTHIHSSISDGGLSHAEISLLYASAGYNFLFSTDHRRPSHFDNSSPNQGLLWLDGVELDGYDTDGTLFHVVCLGECQGITPQTPFKEALYSAQEQGALLILAHPFWSGNSLADTQKYPFIGVEVYNHVCHWLNGKGEGRVHWNAMLQLNSKALCFAADDAHLRPEHPGWNGGWIVVNAPGLSKAAILKAIRVGNFYASTGPQFHTITADQNQVHITTSDVQFIRLVGPRDLGMRVGSFDGKVLREATFNIPKDWQYAYIEIEDHLGKRAWTNQLFCEE